MAPRTSPLVCLLLVSAHASSQTLIDSIPLPGYSSLWGIHVSGDTLFLGNDGNGNILICGEDGVVQSESTTGYDFNHGLVRRNGSCLIAEDYTTNGAGLYEVDDSGTLLNSWTFPDVIGGPSSGIGDLEAEGEAVWYTMYYPDFDVYPFAYAYKWIPGDPAPIDTVPLHGEQPYGIALKGDTLFYVTDNLNGDQERIYAYKLTTEEDLGWIVLPDTPIDNDQRPQGMHYDGEFLYLLANRQGGSAFAYQTVFIYSFDANVGFADATAIDPTTVFPNPACDRIHVHATGSGNYTLMDMHGRLVRSGTIVQRSTIDVRDLVRGVYLLTVETPEGEATHRVVLQ